MKNKQGKQDSINFIKNCYLNNDDDGDDGGDDDDDDGDGDEGCGDDSDVEDHFPKFLFSLTVYVSNSIPLTGYLILLLTVDYAKVYSNH